MREENIIKSSFPSSAFKYFYRDLEEGETVYFVTVEEQDFCAAAALQGYLTEDGWCVDGAECMLVGEVTHLPERVNIRQRPSLEDLDEEKCDSEGFCWKYWDEVCEYKLMPLTTSRLIPREQLAEALHTALRKCCDSTATSLAHAVINMDYKDAWTSYLDEAWALLCITDNKRYWKALKQAANKFGPLPTPGWVVLKRTFDMFSDEDFKCMACFLLTEERG